MRLGKWILGAACVAGCWAGAVLTACGSNSSSGEGNGPESSGATGGSKSGSSKGTGITIEVPTSDAGAERADASATVDANCGSTTSKLERKPADLLLVLDRSESMTRAMDSSDSCDATDSNCSQRWATMRAALQTVLESSSTDVLWGLKFFTTPSTSTTKTSGRNGGSGSGSSGNCYVSSGVEVAVTANTAVSIESQIDQAGTASTTPTRLAIQAAAAYLGTVTDDNPKYILLATDGEPNCAEGSIGSTNSDLPATIAAIQSANDAGYKVFVIGVGPETGNLTALAEAGGTERYYPATTPDELSNALTTIVGTVAAGCTYKISQPPPANPNAIGVYIDKALVARSDTNGWTYDASKAAIVINGDYCEELTSGQKTLVEIFLPCDPAAELPPVIL